MVLCKYKPILGVKGLFAFKKVMYPLFIFFILYPKPEFKYRKSIYFHIW